MEGKQRVSRKTKGEGFGGMKKVDQIIGKFVVPPRKLQRKICRRELKVTEKLKKDPEDR